MLLAEVFDFIQKLSKRKTQLHTSNPISSLLKSREILQFPGTFRGRKHANYYFDKSHLSRLVVGNAIIEHEAKIINAFLTTGILVVFKFLLDLGHVHRVLYNGVVILKSHNISILITTT